MSDNGNDYKGEYSVLKQWPVSLWAWPKVVVYIPMPRALSDAPDVFPHFIEIARHGTPFMHLPYGFADRMRNEAAKQLLDSEYTHILMLDSDHTHPADIVQRLARHIIEDPERLIVGGLNFKRSPPYSPCAYVVSGNDNDQIYRVHDWEPGLTEVSRIGTGSILISREVFERIDFPWFVNEPDLVNQGLGSHDHYLCKLAQDVGIKIWCDFGLVSPHMASHRITEETYRTFCKLNPIPQGELIDA